MAERQQTEGTSSRRVGIVALGARIPSTALHLDELAGLRGVDPAKYRHGLGCHAMALCGPDEGPVDLAVVAAERALRRWSGGLGDIGLLAVGTESALDMSRPVSAWVADRLGLRGSVRSYEVKHACLGATLALRQAVEWKLAGGRGTALVIATDEALYEPSSPGEPTQGAGAVALLVDELDPERPAVAEIDPVSHAWSEPAFDFWRPVGEAFPRVDGQFSLECYKRAASACLDPWLDARHDQDGKGPGAVARFCFHVPFPKMVRKAWWHVAEGRDWDEETTERLFRERVEPTMEWNREIGNSYTGSLWFAVANGLAQTVPGEELLAFSYGSGFGAEALRLVRGGAPADWTADIESDLAGRSWLDAGRYAELREEETAGDRPVMSAV